MSSACNAWGPNGARCELEVAGLLSDLLGFPVRRKLGAGRADDTGDLDGIPDTVVQVANYADWVRAMRIKPPASEVQQANAGATFGATALRMPRGRWLFVMTPDQYATYVREATPACSRSATPRNIAANTGPGARK